jgi:hypothetical protein
MGLDSGVGHASTVSNSQATPEGIAAMSIGMQGLQGLAMSMALGPAVGALGQTIGLTGIPGMVASMLGKSALTQALQGMANNSGGAPTGIGDAGEGDEGNTSSIGDPAADAVGDAAVGGDSGGGGVGDSSGADGGVGSSDGSAYADGGTVPRRPGDPIVGTMGPKRIGSGSGGLSDEAILEATRKPAIPRSIAGPASAASSARGNGLSFQTNRMMREIDNYAEGGEVEGTLLDEMEDPEGVEDTITGQLSVGEYVVPRDVVDTLGVDFFDQLKERYHTPAGMQKAMGI